MNKNETTNTGEVTGWLPEGWNGNGDFFNPDTWSDSSDADGQTENAQDGDGANADSPEPADPPTTGDGEGTENTGAVSPDGSNTEEAAPDAAQTQSETEPEKKTYRLKINHEEREVSLTDEEALRRIQMSYAYEDKATREKFHEIVERLTDEFPTASEQTVRAWAKQEMGGYEPPTEAEEAKEDAETQNKETQKLLDENASLRTQLAAAKAAAGKARKEAQIHKQNAENARRAPIKGASGGGTQKTDPYAENFLRGLRGQ